MGQGIAVTTDAVNNRRAHKSGSALLLEFFGSMNLAITLLVTVGIASIVGTVLKQNEPYQNYIAKFGPFWFEVFNSLGQNVRILANGYYNAGTHSVVWDGKDETGQQVPSGIYFYKLQAGNFTQTKNMILLK